MTQLQLSLLNRRISWHCDLFVVFLDSWFSWWRKYTSTGWIISNSGLSDGWSGCSYWFICRRYLHSNDLWISTRHEKYIKRIYVPNKITTTKRRQKLWTWPGSASKTLRIVKVSSTQKPHFSSISCKSPAIDIVICRTYGYCTDFRAYTQMPTS